MCYFCDRLLCGRQYRYADPRYDELFLGNHIRLLPRAVCGGAVLEEDEPLRRMGWYVERISHRAGSRRQQASIARRRISAYCCKARGAWPCVRGSCNDCIASTLLCCQRH